MSFGNWRASLQPVMSYMDEMIRHNPVILKKVSDDEFRIDFQTKEISSNLRETFHQLIPDKVWDIIYLRNCAELMRTGNKVFSLTKDQVIAMDKTDVNIKDTEIQIPYECFALEIPESCSELFEVDFRNANERLEGAPPRKQKVSLIIFNRIPGLIYTASVYYYGGATSTAACVIKEGHQVSDLYSKENMQSSVVAKPYSVQADGSYLIDGNTPELFDDEFDVLGRLIRVGLNCGLFAASFGVSEDRSNDPIREKLKRRIDKNIEEGNPQRADSSRKELYLIDQKITIAMRTHQAYTQTDGDGDGDIKQVAPHWRRGHWRMQRHGVDLQNTKRVFIRPVFVNAHLFKGDIVNCRTSYKIKGDYGK